MTTLTFAPATTYTVRFSALVPTTSALAAEIALVRELAEPGARVVVDVPAVNEPDADAARQRRTTLELLDALSGLKWRPVRLIGSSAELAIQAQELAHEVGADEVRYRG